MKLEHALIKSTISKITYFKMHSICNKNNTQNKFNSKDNLEDILKN